MKNDWMNVTGKGKGSTERFMEQFSKVLTNQSIANILDNMTIDDILRGLIEDSDLIEVACCLDMIAQEDGKKVVLFCKKEGRIYPAPGVVFPDISLPEVSEVVSGELVDVEKYTGCGECNCGNGNADG